jgi:hypothetical protein
MLPQGDPSLDVTRHLGAAKRFWCIGQSQRRDADWNYERRNGTSVSFGELASLQEALDERRQFDAEIAAARRVE